MKGNPIEYLDTICGAVGDSIEIVLINGDEYGENRVTSAKIMLNGTELFSPKNFNENVDTLRKTVVLTQDYNELSVRVEGSPSSFIVFNAYYTIPVNQFDAVSIVSYLDDETGDTIKLEDPYYPLILDAAEVQNFIKYEQDLLINHHSNTLNFSLAKRGDIVTVGVKKLPWTPFVKIYLITHDGIIANPNPINEWDRSATIHAHPTADGKNGVHYIYTQFWHGYDWIQFDRVTYNTTILNNVMNYADAQEDEPYTYDWRWKYYTYKWYCSSLVWRSYYDGSGKTIDVDFIQDCAVTPLEIVRDGTTTCIAHEHM